MKAMRLLELIGEVDDRFIEESFGKPAARRRKHYRTLAMAAVLALALIGGGAVWLRWGGNTFTAGSAAPAQNAATADSAPAEAAAEAAVPAEGAEKAAEAPAAAAEPVPAPVMEEAEEAAPAEETVEAPAEAEEDLAAVAPEEPEAFPAPAETALPYDLNGDPLTIYFREGEDWQAETRTGREAKYLCALMNIEELRPGTPGEPVCVIDFGNGTLAELYGPGDGGAIYTCPQGVSFTPDLLEDLRYQRELSVYDYVIFPEGTWEEVNREE